jgi:hypothetical protein
VHRSSTSRFWRGYADKLDGKISEDFWQRQRSQWQAEEQQVKQAMDAMAQPKAEILLDVQRTLELTKKAYSLYLTQKQPNKPNCSKRYF